MNKSQTQENLLGIIIVKPVLLSKVQHKVLSELGFALAGDGVIELGAESIAL